MATSADDPAAEANRLILEAATGVRELSDDELQRVLEHIAQAGFFPAPNAKAGGRLAGLTWQGRTLTGGDRLPPAEVHYLRHVVARREWPTGTTLEDYLGSGREAVLDPTSGTLASQLHALYWHLTIVRRSGRWQGPQGYEWMVVEYRVELGHWVTIFQLQHGLATITDDPERHRQRWLRQPT